MKKFKKFPHASDYHLIVLLKEAPPKLPERAKLYVSQVFRDYTLAHWRMQTLMSVPEPRGCKLDYLVDDFCVDLVVDASLREGEIILAWKDEEGVEQRRGVEFQSLPVKKQTPAKEV